MADNPPEGQENLSTEGDQGSDHYELSGDFRGAVINIKSTIIDSADIGSIENQPPDPGEPPFQGLQYFDEDDASRFFGREQLTARIIGRMHRSRFLAIIGASGSGKSSLVRAGVIPALKAGLRLEDGALPPHDSGKWGIHMLTPGARPLESLASTLLYDSDSLSEISLLAEELELDPLSFPLAIQRYLSKHAEPHLLLVIDQFEELFTLSRRKEEREAFVACLTAGLNDRDEYPFSILIVLRADYYAQVAQQDVLRESVSQYQEFIGAMNRDELVRAIDQPLAQGDWQIQEGLMEVILDDVGYEPGALPLLSHALLETWKRRRGRTLTLSGYRDAGGVRGAIAETAEAVFEQQLSSEQQPIARMIFMRLTEIGEDSSDTRRRATFGELITRATDELTIETVIKILSDSRLVITDTVKPGDVRVVEVAHEAIIREWPTLRGWLDEDRESLILHQKMSDDAEDWLHLEKDPGFLYRGSRLEMALGWADQHSNSLNKLESEFLEQSQKSAAEEAEQLRRLARATRNQRIFLGVAGLLVIIVGYLAYTNFFVREPGVMDGFYNIAVAEITGEQAEGVDQASVIDSADLLTEGIYTTLQETLGENPNILIWHDGPELDDKFVNVGGVGSPDSAIEFETAAEKAARLNADMVIYGAYDQSQDPAVLNLNYYLAPQENYNFEDIQGTFQIVEIPIRSDELQDLQPISEKALTSQVNSLAWVALGLTEAQLGHSVEALEAFLQADTSSPSSETVQFFIGREYLFLVDREVVLDIASEAFEERAENYFLRAIELNPDFSRAYIGLGGVYFKQSRDLLPDALSLSDPTVTLQNALAINQQAISTYESATLRAAEDSDPNLPLEAIAQLGLGNSSRQRADILTQLGKYEDAEKLLDQAISALEGTLDDLERTGQIRYLTQAYEYLGGSFTSLAFIQEINQKIEDSLASYNIAISYYDLCIDQADLTQDLIIQREISQQICMPNRQAVQEILDNYSGGQG